MRERIREKVRGVLTESAAEDDALVDLVVEAAVAVENDLIQEAEEILRENEEILAMGYEMMLDRIFDDYTRGLTMTQKDRMRRICDDFTLDPADPFEDYRDKLSDLADDMFPKKAVRSNFEDERFPEGDDATYANDPLMRSALGVSNYLGSLRAKNDE